MPEEKKLIFNIDFSPAMYYTEQCFVRTVMQPDQDKEQST